MTLVWSATGLPSGLTCAENGQIRGTPTQYGDFNPRITLHEQGFLSAVKTFPLKIWQKPDNLPFKVTCPAYTSAYNMWSAPYARFTAPVNGQYTFDDYMSSGARYSHVAAMKAGESLDIYCGCYQNTGGFLARSMAVQWFYMESGGKRVLASGTMTSGGRFESSTPPPSLSFQPYVTFNAWRPPSFNY